MSNIPATIIILPEEDAFTFWEGEALPKSAVAPEVLETFEPRLDADHIKAMLEPAPSQARN